MQQNSFYAAVLYQKPAVSHLFYVIRHVTSCLIADIAIYSRLCFSRWLQRQKKKKSVQLLFSSTQTSMEAEYVRKFLRAWIVTKWHQGQLSALTKQLNSWRQNKKVGHPWRKRLLECFSPVDSLWSAGFVIPWPPIESATVVQQSCARALKCSFKIWG